MIGTIVAIIFMIPLSILALAPFILAGNTSREKEHRAELHDADERARLLGQELKKYLGVAKDRDLSHDAEMKWERAMMVAIGEDGIKSVSDAIARLKVECYELQETIAKGDCKTCMVRRGIVSSARDLEIEVER